MLFFKYFPIKITIGVYNIRYTIIVLSNKCFSLKVHYYSYFNFILKPLFLIIGNYTYSCRSLKKYIFTMYCNNVIIFKIKCSVSS